MKRVTALKNKAKTIVATIAIAMTNAIRSRTAFVTLNILKMYDRLYNK